MNIKDFYFDLPKNLIAQTPLLERDNSRLLVLDKHTGNISHHKFNHIINFLNEGDCLVLNNTKVMPARLYGIKENTGGKVEILLLKRLSDTNWEVLVSPGKKARPNDIIIFNDGLLKAKVIDIVEDGNRILEFEYNGVFEEILDKIGEMPLPPYITEKLSNKNRYQTIYAKETGSAAAPTAGLHFTAELLEQIKNKNINIAYVTLHVGLGTFRPVKVSNVLEHKMHSEYYYLDKTQSDIINKAKKNNKKVIAVGTTSCRVLETCATSDNLVKQSFGQTDIFIYPGYKFKVVDNLITNFHLPESTLIMLVSAFSTRDFIINAYNTAVEQNYRFFSFGDAMFIC